MIVHILLSILIVALFLYSKLAPHKARLTGKYRSVFLFFEKVFDMVLHWLRKVVNPAQVGNGIAVDMSQVVLLILLLVFLMVRF
ncbi:MAG: YggT family protein [Bacteroidales bacterium]|jgi:hypothetical protein|nr:YggT family protein [Bacteroidales bacterium]